MDETRDEGRGEPGSDGKPARSVGSLAWLRDTVSFYGVLVLMAVVLLGWSLLGNVLSPLLPRELGARLGQAVIRIGFRCFVQLMVWSGIVSADLGALDALRDDRGLVIVANHPALIDIVLVGSRLPRMVCIVKASLFGNPMLGGAKVAGYLRNDSPLSLVRGAAAVLRGGSNLLIFPEGTRSPRGQVAPFKPGFAAIARAAGSPIQPVFIQSNTRYLEKGWPIWRRPELPLRYRVRLGSRVSVEGRAEVFSEQLRARFAEAVERTPL